MLEILFFHFFFFNFVFSEQKVQGFYQRKGYLWPTIRNLATEQPPVLGAELAKSCSLILMMSHFLLSQKSTGERFLVHCFSLDEKALIPKEEIIYLLTEAS